MAGAWTVVVLRTRRRKRMAEKVKRKRVEVEPSESQIKSRIRALLGSLPDVRLFTNPTGYATEEQVSYGLARYSADLIGVVAPYGRFLSIETKRADHRTDSRRSRGQADWARMVRDMGGVAGEDVQNEEQAMALVEEARRLP